MKILLAVASPLEIQGFNLESEDVDVLIVGIGKLAAYKSLRDRLAEHKYDLIVNAGTCGSNLFPKGSVIKPNAVSQGDSFVSPEFPSECFVLDNRNYLPEFIRLLSSDNFISSVKAEDGSTALPAVVSKFNCFDMEGYSVCLAAKDFNIPVRIIKIVSDNLDGTLSDWAKETESLAPVLVSSIKSLIREYIPNYETSRS